MKNLQADVRGVFAEVTRYPLEILDPQSNLEEELGIDSVKLGEVFSVLRERYHLPHELNIPRESLLTIAGVTNALATFVVSTSTNGIGPKYSLGAAEAQQSSHLVATAAAAAGGSHTNGFSTHVVSPQPPSPPSADVDLLERVCQVFAEVTRYPREILDPAAGLEDELGIDSVKLGEVFSVLREEYALPAELDIPRESLATISGIAAALRRHVVGKSKAAPPAAALKPPTTIHLKPSTGDFAQAVIDVFAEVTRYPREILDPTADLEQDLGIDSVKLGEVFSVLRERFSLPAELDIPREQLRTLRDIAAGLSRYGSAPALPAVAAMPTSPHTNGYTNGHPNGSGSALDSRSAVHVNGRSEAAALYSYKSPESKPFAGKVLFVSGSGRGLGKDIATYLAELGASVVINSFHSRDKGDQTVAEIREQGGEALHLWGSMANPEHVNRVFDEIESHYGQLDYFVGNASNGMLARLEDLTVEHWEKAYRTNVIGLHQSALRAVKLMRRRGGGKIITLSSPAAHGYVDYFGCMGTVKAAVESLTRSMAIEFAPYNIQVNCVSPGPVYGELLNKWPDSERLIRQWESNTAYNRLCEARDVSHFIAYLLSEPVKLFTGSVLVMDGGISSQGW